MTHPVRHLPVSDSPKQLARGPESIDILLLLGVNIVWGSTYVVARGVLESAPPLVLAFLRFALAALVMLAFRCHRPPVDGNPASPRRSRMAGTLAVMGIVGFGLAKLLNYEGLARSTATDAALNINLETVFTAVLAALLLHQRLRGREWAGIWVAF